MTSLFLEWERGQKLKKSLMTLTLQAMVIQKEAVNFTDESFLPLNV